MHDLNISFFIVSVVGGSLVFAVGHTSSPADPYPFPTVKTIRGNQWDTSSHRFTIIEAQGVYLVGLAVRARQQIDYTLIVSGQRFAGITKTANTDNDAVPVGREVIAQFYAADTLHVFSGYENLVESSSYFIPSVTIFSISDCMMEPPVMFSVAKRDTLSGSINPFPFDHILYNNEFHFEPLNSRFWAPSAGVYYFTFSVGLVAFSSAEFILYKNDEPFATILRTSTLHNGDDMIGRSVMMQLQTEDSVHIGNTEGRVARSSPLIETSFSGFKYEPRHRDQVSTFLQNKIRPGKPSLVARLTFCLNHNLNLPNLIFNLA